MTAAHVVGLIAKHRTSGVVIDTNLMLLLVIGTYDPERIPTFKRTIKYTERDYKLVLDLISRFARRVTIPNILTEVDNLSRQTAEGEHSHISRTMSRLLDNLVEVYRPSASVVGTQIHAQVGLSDALIISLAEEHLILTDDFPLSNRLESAGRDVINLNHLRL